MMYILFIFSILLPMFLYYGVAAYVYEKDSDTAVVMAFIGVGVLVFSLVVGSAVSKHNGLSLKDFNIFVADSSEASK